MATSDAPISIGRVTLVVNDLDRMGGFYEEIIGLNLINRDGELAVFGVGGMPLLELQLDKAARRRPHEAGLFHTAFLVPEREDLGLWLRHASGLGLRINGASDHLVSEALYLSDPEGNGIEIYRDRPHTDWVRKGDEIEMATLPLDVQELATTAKGDWKGAPTGTVIGHVHLQVGNVDAADEFMRNTLGLTQTYALPSAGWYGAGGYHHHLAVNVWNSKRAGPRTPQTTGLAEVELLADPNTLPAGTLTDPWKNHFKITARQARAA